MKGVGAYCKYVKTQLYFQLMVLRNCFLWEQNVWDLYELLNLAIYVFTLSTSFLG